MIPNDGKIAETLKAAKALIDTPEKWTKGTMARDANGLKVEYTGKRAVCFCASGAIRRADAGLVAAKYYLGVDHVSTWNDAPERTHAEVMAKFDERIAYWEARS